MEARNELIQLTKELDVELDYAMQKLGVIDDEDIRAIEKQRREELKRQAKFRDEMIQKGHLEYTEIPSEKDFFEAVKKSKFFVCHFYRPSTMRCAIFDKHLTSLACLYGETRFCKINAEKSPFLCKRLGVKILPTLILCKENKVIDRIIGFDELGGVDDFESEELAWAISKRGILKYSGKPPASVMSASNAKQPNFTFHGKPLTKTIRGRSNDSDSDDD
ncbi:thioredoxin domain-containing protein 9-like [Uloborus diversus]|uniref:thioredoxin domain-containing protein 9-like n=1 Tax=Uloborus diversus TaxID=327109 RepID=UPI002409FF1B|nr:thioredoxin domain-containing protein 9-like [Uloborus diversus]